MLFSSRTSHYDSVLPNVPNKSRRKCAPVKVRDALLPLDPRELDHLAHFSVSSAMSLPKSAGELIRTSGKLSASISSIEPANGGIMSSGSDSFNVPSVLR